MDALNDQGTSRLRTLMERMGRNRTLRRSLPREFGSVPLYVSPDAQLKYLLPGASGFDASLLMVVREALRQGDAVWDIGANVGVFTFAAAGRRGAGPVLAVEPDLWLVRLLNRSLAIPQNHRLNVSVLPAAISDTVGVSRLLIAERGRASNTLDAVGERPIMGGVRGVQTVATLTLDVLLDETFPPDFVKIDVEGAEAAALCGATRLLEAVRPRLYLEVSEANREAVTDMLQTREYRLFDSESGQELDVCSFSTVAIPAEDPRA